MEGRAEPHYRGRLGRVLAHIDLLQVALAQLVPAIERGPAPSAAAGELLGRWTRSQAWAPRLPPSSWPRSGVAEIGPGTGHFASATHLASWAGVAPGGPPARREAARRAGAQGQPLAAGVLGEVAWAVSHTKADCLAAQYHRLARRRGKDKAILAVAHSVLGIAHHVLRHRGPYADLGPDYFARFEAGRVVHHHVCKLRRLGRQVALAPTAAAPRRAA